MFPPTIQYYVFYVLLTDPGIIPVAWTILLGLPARLSELSVAALYMLDHFWGQLFGPINGLSGSKNANSESGGRFQILGRKGPHSGKFDRIKRLARHIACLSRDNIAAASASARIAARQIAAPA
jgi:hypothetical protein